MINAFTSHAHSISTASILKPSYRRLGFQITYLNEVQLHNRPVKLIASSIKKKAAYKSGLSGGDIQLANLKTLGGKVGEAHICFVS